MPTPFEKPLIPGVTLAVGHLIIDMDGFRQYCQQGMDPPYSDYELLTGLHAVLMRKWGLQIPLGEWIDLIEWVNGHWPGRSTHLILYHCSPRRNRRRINAYGLHVRYCRCPGTARLYLVGFQHLKAAVRKVSRRHHVPAQRVDVYGFHIERHEIANYQGHTVTFFPIAPNRLTRFAWTLSA